MTKYRPLLALVIIASAILAVASVRADVVSTFEIDAEGWVSFGNGGASLSHSATGGNPGGYLSSIDQSDSWTYVQAPLQFSTPARLNGTLSFDLRATTNNPTSAPIAYGVRAALVGAGLTLINEAAIPTSDWTSYSFALTESSGWRVLSNLDQNYNPGAPQPSLGQFIDVIYNLSGVYIAADYADFNTLNGITEETQIDNVRLSTIPEPATALVATSGIVLLALSRHIPGRYTSRRLSG